MVSFSGDRRLKPIPSSKVTSDKTLMSENSLLRDQVEKERFRRKVSFSLCGRWGGLMVSALDSGASAPGSSPGRDHCVVFLGKTLNSHGASLHPGV